MLATGQLATLDNQIDTTTGTLKLRAIFANPDELLYPNQFVNARLLVNTLHDTVRVPAAAIQRGEPGTYVYLIDAANKVSVRPVRLGPTDEGQVAVLSGLQAGDRVVVDGTDRLRDGAAVIVADTAKRPSYGRGQPGQAGKPDAGASSGAPGGAPGGEAPRQGGGHRSPPPQ